MLALSIDSLVLVVSRYIGKHKVALDLGGGKWILTYKSIEHPAKQNNTMKMKCESDTFYATDMEYYGVLTICVYSIGKSSAKCNKNLLKQYQFSAVDAGTKNIYTHWHNTSTDTSINTDTGTDKHKCAKTDLKWCSVCRHEKTFIGHVVSI